MSDPYILEHSNIDGLARKFKGGSNDTQKPKAEVESDEDIF